MKVGILSDTHNDTHTLQTILRKLREEKVSTIIHCGDVTSPSTIKYFNGFTVHLAFGNCDYMTGALNEALILLGTESTAKRLNVLTILEKKILIAHGNYEKEFHDFVLSERFDLVFTGHSHQRSNTVVGRTRIINPGASSRTGKPSYSYAIYEFNKNNLEYHQVK